MRTNRLASARTALGLAALAVAGVACADKAFVPVNATVNPRMKLFVTTTASQVAPTARYVWVAAASIIPGGDTELIAMTTVPVSGTSQTVKLDIDISRCLSATAAKGGSGCSILVAAALRADSIAATDTSNADPFTRTFDYVLAGPYDVSSGRAPTIPPIDLSASRFSLFDWTQDEALRLGAAEYVVATGGTPQGRVLAGTYSGTASPVLYTVTQGNDFSKINTSPTTAPLLYPALAIFENGSWRRALATVAPAFNTANTSVPQGFMDVTALATNDVYIAATSGLYKYDGAAFTKISQVTDTLYSVASAPLAGGGRVVIAAGASGKTWIGYGTNWTAYPTGSTSRFDGVCITGQNEAFASSSSSGALYRFNGTTWTSVPAPFASSPKQDLQCPGPGQAYVSSGGQTFYKWTGSTWVALPTTGLNPARVLRMAVVSGNEIYAAGDSVSTNRAFYRFDGTSWTAIGPQRPIQGPSRLWADPRGGSAYVHSAFGRLDKITPSAVSALSFQPALRDVVMTSSNSAFAVGQNLFLARWDGAKWTVDAPPAGTQTTRVLQGVWADGPSNAWAVGTSNTILRYNGSAWSVVSDANKTVATADSYNAVWGSGSDVWVAGENTIVHCKASVTCVLENSGGGILYSLWGSSTSNIFAVGAGGHILRFNGTSWSAMASPTARNLARVAGSGANDIWAFGDSVLVHFDGTQWTNIPFVSDLLDARTVVPSPYLQSTFQAGLWVRGPKEAYLAGDFGGFLRWDGSGWRHMNSSGPTYTRRVLAISGAAGCTMAVTEGNSDAPAPTLWRGIGTNGCLSSPMGAPSSWP
jgi:hypothetical protein